MNINLKNLRESKNLTKKQLAVILKISYASYCRYENNNANIPIDVLKKLAIYLDTSTDYIAGITDEIKPHRRKKGLKIIF